MAGPISILNRAILKSPPVDSDASHIMVWDMEKKEMSILPKDEITIDIDIEDVNGLQEVLDSKLDRSEYNQHYRGKFSTEEALEIAIPVANDGDYAIVDGGTGQLALQYIWDLEEGWILSGEISPETTDELIEGNTNLYFKAFRVLGTTLSGLSALVGGPIIDTDTILIAFGKVKKDLADIFTSLNLKLDKGSYTGTAQTLKADIDAIYQPDILISAVTPTRSVNTFTYPATQYQALISKTIRTNPAAFVTTIAAATTDYKRVDLIYFKNDNTIAKIVGTESLTVAIRPDVPANAVGISFINVFGNVIDTPTPITTDISIQNSGGIEQFKIKDYIRFRGSSFDSAQKQVVIDPLTPFTAFVDCVSGNNTTAEFGNVNKPYLTIDAVFTGLTDSVSRLIIVQLIRIGTYPVNNVIPTGQTTIRSTLAVTLDLSANANQYLFTYNNGALAGVTFTFDIPFGKILNARTSSGTGTSIAQAQTAFLLNIKEISWSCSSFIFYGLTNQVIFQKLDILDTVGTITQGSAVFIPYLKISTLTIRNGAIGSQFAGIETVEITNLILNSTNGQFTGNVNFKIGNVTGTGLFTFGSQSGVTSIEFLNSTIVPSFKLNQAVNNVTLSGNIKSCSFDVSTQASDGIFSFKNLNIDTIVSGHVKCFSTLTFNVINCTIKMSGRIFEKSNSGNANATVNITSSTIEQVTPAALVTCAAGSTIALKIAGLETNALSLGDNSLTTVTYALLSFKDKKNEIVVRSKVDIVNKVLDSNMTYIIDGSLVLLTGEYIDIPATGLTIAGYGFNPSSISKNISGQSIFRSPAGNSGDFVTRDITYNPGLGSVFNLTDATGTHAIELNDVNFQGVTGSSLGTLNGYRQFTGTTCGFYNLSDGLTLEGNWSGFKLTNSNIIGFGASGTLFKKGSATLFSNRFYIDLNLQVATGSKICDFDPANFTNNKSFQVVNCYAKVNGVVDASTTSSTFPNITETSVKAYFVNNIGIKNSNISPYGISGTNLLTYVNDAAASAGGIVQVGEFYIESVTGYLKQRLV